MDPQPSSRRSVVALLAALPLALIAAPRPLAARLVAPPADPQPHMKAALASLVAARTHLNQATPDKGGHRAKALIDVAEAIKETEAGIRFDNTH